MTDTTTTTSTLQTLKEKVLRRKVVTAILVAVLSTGVLIIDKIDQETYAKIITSVVSMVASTVAQ